MTGYDADRARIDDSGAPGAETEPYLKWTRHIVLFMATIFLIAACGVFAASSDQAMAHLGSGLALFGEQKYSEAATEFSLALESDPHLVDARYHLAIAHFEARESEEARKQFEQLVSTGYKRRWVAYYLGRLDLREGKLDSAIQRLESIQRRQPLHDELYYLGSAFLKKRDPKQAAKFLCQEIAFNPRDFRAHYLLGRTYLELGRKKQARHEFDESNRLNQYFAQGKQDLTTCQQELQRGEVQAAWSRCGSVLQTTDIDNLVAVGMLFGKFADYNHALRAFQKAQTLDSQSPEINYDLAYTYYQMKKYSEAAHSSQVAVQGRPYFFEALEVYGLSLCQLKKDEAARSALSRAHQLRPQDEKVNGELARINASLPN
ncbi:MAG TPA: tetratricopeptide repeat protein [Terriglobia bacterium]|nr:tetratricopeptide repeat protein [Terriglobia bacterium]